MAELRNGSWRADYVRELAEKHDAIVRNPENLLAEILSQYETKRQETLEHVTNDLSSSSLCLFATAPR